MVDPGDADPVLRFLDRHGLKLEAVLCTHHHGDHAGGLPELSRVWPGLPIYGPDNPALADRVNHPVGEGDTVELLGLRFEVMAVPAHTLDHIAFYAAPYLFCGDTMFACGCGRLFEGTPEQLHQALARFSALPGDTMVCCAHEYTLSNQRFALAVEPDNQPLRLRYQRDQARRERGEPTLPARIDEERACNPFLRTAEPTVAASATGHAGRPLADSVSVLAALRRWKDDFRG